MTAREFAPIERPDDHPLVRSSVTDGIGRITFADAERRNAYRIEFSLDLQAAVAEMVDRDARVVIVDAVAPVFCSGGDLDDLLSPRASLVDIGRAARSLAELEVPTIAIVDGAVIGAGINLVIACDVVICSPRATFDPRLLDLGVHPGGGQLRELSRRIGRQGAVALSLLGDTLTGTDAAATGLAWRCVDADELEPLAMRWAQRVVSRPDAAIRRAKSVLDATIDLDPDAAAAIELEAQQWSIDQPWIGERVEALRARLAERRR